MTVRRCPLPDPSVLQQARAHQASLTKPRGSLGRLEEVAVQMAAWQGCVIPAARPAEAIVFASDHPVTQNDVSPYPSSVTRAMLGNFSAGGAAASVLCRKVGIGLSIVDVGVDLGVDVGVDGVAKGVESLPGSGASEGAAPERAVPVRRERVASWPVGDIRVKDAMGVDVFAACVDAGRDSVQRCEPGLRVLIPGDMGIGNTTVAASVCAAILREDAAFVVGAGAGADALMVERKRRVVSEAISRLSSSDTALDVLRRVGGREIAAIYGAMQAALERRVTVLVDGFIATTAALVLCEVEPRAKAGMIFAHRSDESGHARVLAHLGAVPLLDLGMRLGEASGALLAFSLIEQACVLHAEMASFASSGVPDRD